MTIIYENTIVLLFKLVSITANGKDSILTAVLYIMSITAFIIWDNIFTAISENPRIEIAPKLYKTMAVKGIRIILAIIK